MEIIAMSGALAVLQLLVEINDAFRSIATGPR